MDPETVYQMILDAIAVDDTETVSESADNLQAWIDRGGFLPAEMESFASHVHETAGQYVESGDYMDFRIYIRPDGSASLATGDGSCDQDHRGYCGADSIESGASLDDCRAAVVRCFFDALESFWTSK